MIRFAVLSFLLVPGCLAVPAFSDIFDPSKWDFNAGLRTLNSWLSDDKDTIASHPAASPETCFGKIKTSLKTDPAFDQILSKNVREGKVEEAIEETLAQAGKVCDRSQQDRMVGFFKKYGSTIMNAKDILAEVSTDERIQVKEWIVENNGSALQKFVTEKGVAFLLNPKLSSKLLDVAVSIPTIQMELQNNPI